MVLIMVLSHTFAFRGWLIDLKKILGPEFGSLFISSFWGLAYGGKCTMLSLSSSQGITPVYSALYHKKGGQNHISPFW